MAKFIVNPKNPKGIIAELIGEGMIKIIKRRSDYHPIQVIMKGTDWDAVVNCTLTGEPVYINCVGGKIDTSNLTIIEKESEDGKEIKGQGASGAES